METKKTDYNTKVSESEYITTPEQERILLQH